MKSISDDKWELTFLRWAFANSVIDSNTQLASLSNVCRRWRSIVATTIVEDVIDKLGTITTKNNLASGTQCIQKDERDQLAQRSELLLLPSIVNRVISGKEIGSTVRLPSNFPGSREARCNNENEESFVETFCLAWFPSEGIVETLVDLTQRDNLESVADIEDTSIQSGISRIPVCSGTQATTFMNFHQNPVFVGGELYEGSDCDDRRSTNTSSSKQLRRCVQRSRSPIQYRQGTSNSLSKICTEWRGFRSASEVLRPFGFATVFVDEVLRITQSLQQSTTAYNNTHDEPYFSTTYAVRGATVARPEQYCLCLDRKNAVVSLETDDLSTSLLKSIDMSMSEDYSSYDDSDSSSDRVAIRIEEYKKSLKRREMHKLDLQRDFVPRSVLLQSDCLETDLRCVQFLNSSGSHAVCMVTPPFACGPIPEPITVFCVGVAVEDGCLMSSLNHRFELGHMYPADDIAKCTEMSSICLATGAWNDSIMADISRKKKYDWNTVGCGIAEEEAGSLTRNSNCACLFQDNISKANQPEDDSFRTIHRGCIGPGKWHCYTAIFDGERSQIRIDGIPEPMSHTYELGNSPKLKKIPIGIPMLDGLTIGSDHYFGMSLCCGNGSDGEGEGAISELAVFKGRLCDQDLYTLERDLMSKHGIESPCRPDASALLTRQVPVTTTSSSTSVWRDNTFERQAHALMLGNDAFETPNRLASVPLSYLARHRSVAWQKRNPVTHETILMNKIGQKLRVDDSSSEF